MTGTSIQTSATLASYLAERKAELAKIGGKKEAEIAAWIPRVVARASRRPELFECTPRSVFEALKFCVDNRLEPEGIAGHVYLVPYWNNKAKNENGEECRRREVEAQLGYKGLIELIRRHEDNAEVGCDVVYKGDEFSFIRTPWELRHQPDVFGEQRDDDIVGAYAFVREVDGQVHSEFMNRKMLLDRMRRSKSKDKQGNPVGPWKNDFARMCRKSVLRTLAMNGIVKLDLRSPIEDLVGDDDPEEVIEVSATVRDSEPEALPKPTADQHALPQADAKDGLIEEIGKLATTLGTDHKKLLGMAAHKWGRNIASLSALKVGQLATIRDGLRERVEAS